MIPLAPKALAIAATGVGAAALAQVGAPTSIGEITIAQAWPVLLGFVALTGGGGLVGWIRSRDAARKEIDGKSTTKDLEALRVGVAKDLETMRVALEALTRLVDSKASSAFCAGCRREVDAGAAHQRESVARLEERFQARFDAITALLTEMRDDIRQLRGAA